MSLSHRSNPFPGTIDADSNTPLPRLGVRHVEDTFCPGNLRHIALLWEHIGPEQLSHMCVIGLIRHQRAERPG